MNKIKNVFTCCVIFILSIVVTFQIGGFFYYLSYDYEKGDYHKYYELNYISTVYHKTNIFLGNCNYIKDYHLYKIDASPFQNSKSDLNELIMLTKNCPSLNNDYHFLLVLHGTTNNLLKLSNIEQQILISKYWFFLKTNKEFFDLITNESNKELIDLLTKEFK